MQINDEDIRVAVRAHVRQAHGPEALVLDELALAGGRSRLDVSAITDQLHGYEIKGQGDTTLRLSRQAADYNKVCWSMTLIATSNHLHKCLRPGKVPEWWHIYVAVPVADNVVYLELRRPGYENPTVSAEALLRMLWREEIDKVRKMFAIEEEDVEAALGAMISPHDALRIVKMLLLARRDRRDWDKIHRKDG